MSPYRLFTSLIYDVACANVQLVIDTVSPFVMLELLIVSSAPTAPFLDAAPPDVLAT